MKVPLDEATFDPLPSVDPVERVFRWNGKLLRAVPALKVDHYRGLVDGGVLPRLIEQGLVVKTEVTDLLLDGYGLVLEHQDVPFRSFPMEWCSAMLKDAALKLIRLFHELARARLTLQHAYPWQTLFNGPRNYFFDVGAIIPATEGLCQTAHEDLLHHWVLPLRVMAAGHARVARWLLHDYTLGVLPPECEALTKEPQLAELLRHWRRQTISLGKRWTPTVVRRGLRQAVTTLRPQRPPPPCQSGVPFTVLEGLYTEIEALPTSGSRTEWSEYSAVVFPDFTAPETWDDKRRSWEQILTEVRPRTLLDIGSNRGWFAQLAARRGIRVVATDVDEPSLTRCYFDAKESDLPLLPLLLDVRNPTPGYGVANEWFPPATQRLRVDLVSMLAVMHHLVFKHGLAFESIFRGLSAFATRALVVEFVGAEDRYVRNWWSDKYPSWYTLENLRGLLRREYSTVKEFPSNLDHRVLLLCTR